MIMSSISKWLFGGSAKPTAQVVEGDYVRPDELPALTIHRTCFRNAERWPSATTANMALQLASTLPPRITVAGIATSLYDIADAETGRRSGEPIADKFCVVAGEDFAWIAVADGVNWGPKPALAAQNAVEGSTDCIRQLATTAFSNRTKVTTRDIANWLFQAVLSAQERVISSKGTLTTLCCGLAVRLTDGRLVFICVSVGDSRAYLLPIKGVAVHITDDHVLRGDVRETGGVLGFANGEDPDLSNMRFFMQPLDQGDTVMLCTDGVHDNLDPEIRHEIPRPKSREEQNSTPENDQQRAKLKQQFIIDHLTQIRARFSPTADVKDIVQAVLDDVEAITSQQRDAVHAANLYSPKTPEQDDDMYFQQVKQREQHLNVLLPTLPGKMDHATAVAFSII